MCVFECVRVTQCVCAQARVATQQEELVEMRKKFERSRGDLKQRTVDVHMLQVRVAQLCGSELDGLTVRCVCVSLCLCVFVCVCAPV